jgi:hypothetical protein
LHPYLKGIGSDYSNGVNFAMAGSTVTHGVSDYSLNVQIDQFVYFKHRSLELFEQGSSPLSPNICTTTSIPTFLARKGRGF